MANDQSHLEVSEELDNESTDFKDIGMISPSSNQTDNISSTMNLSKNRPQVLPRLPQPQQQQRNSFFRNHNRTGQKNHNRDGQASHHNHNRNGGFRPHYGVENQGWYAHSYATGWNYATPPPIPHFRSNGFRGNMIPPFFPDFFHPMARYIPPNFGQYNMYNHFPAPPPPPPPPPSSPQSSPPSSPRTPPPSPPPETDQTKPSDNQGLYWRIVNQVNYYFSDKNLRTDTFLKSRMDAAGWVPIILIATFFEMQKLTHDVEFIQYALQGSSVVEVSGDKVRRRKRFFH